MKKFEIRNFKAITIVLAMFVLSTLGCEKEKFTEATVEKTETYIFENQEYTVKMIKNGEDYVPIENETTKMLSEAMENPTSSVYLDLSTGKNYLFRTSEIGDAFIENVKEANKSTGNKILKAYNNNTVDYFTDRYFTPSCLITSISGVVDPGFPNAGDKVDLASYGCDNQISSVWLHGRINGNGLYVTLCEHPSYGGHRCYLSVAAGVNGQANLYDYVMIRWLGIVNKRWDREASSIYYGI